MLPCRTDLPWWVTLAAVSTVFVVVLVRRARAGFTLSRDQWGTHVSRIVSLYLVLGLPQLSHTLLTTSNPCSITDSGEMRRLVVLLLSIPVLAVITELAPLLMPEAAQIPRTELGLPTARGWGALLGRAALVVLAGNVLQLALWSGSSWVPGLTLHGLGLAEVALLVIFIRVVGRLIDAIVLRPGPRVIGVLVALPGVLFAYGPLSPPDEVRFAPVDRRNWYDTALARLDQLPEDGPAIFVAASGGGSRAAFFASLVFETLNARPEALTVFEGGSRPVQVNWTRPLSDYVFAVSSVSGGSVASAAYVAARAAGPAPERSFRAGGKLWPSVLEGIGPQVGNDEWHAALRRSELLDVTMTDFNTVAVHGFLAPASTRGQELAAFWESQFGWTERITQAAPGAVPLLLVNATLAESGRPLVLGYPPLPDTLLADQHLGSARLAPVAAERIARVPIARLSKTDTVPVGTAVRLSASFPFGMDAARLEVEGEREGQRGVRELHITDGGVVDNTGTGTFRGLLASLEAQADDEPRAAELVARLKRRGVLVIEIDSGAKPLPSYGVAQAFFAPAIQASNAVSQAGYTNERDAVELRRRLLRKSGYRLSWATFSYCPKSDDDEVMTAWGLGAGDMSRLATQFFTETLPGACSERPVPRRLPSAEADGLSPLNTIAAAFQRSDAPSWTPMPAAYHTATPYTQGDPTAVTDAGQQRDRFVLTAVDNALLAGSDSSAIAAAAFSPDPMVANAAGTLAGVARTLAGRDDGRVHTIDSDAARSGWFAAARFQDGVLQWCKIAAACGDGLSRAVGSNVWLAGPVLIHEPESPGAFAPGFAVALAETHANLEVLDRLDETIEGARTIYLSVTWRPSIAQIAPCTALERLLITCPEREADAAVLRELMLAGGSIRGACLEMYSRTGDPPGVWVDALLGLEGDALALAGLAGTPLGYPVEVRVILDPQRDATIALHFCPAEDPHLAPDEPAPTAAE